MILKRIFLIIWLVGFIILVSINLMFGQTPDLILADASEVGSPSQEAVSEALVWNGNPSSRNATAQISTNAITSSSFQKDNVERQEAFPNRIISLRVCASHQHPQFLNQMAKWKPFENRISLFRPKAAK